MIDGQLGNELDRAYAALREIDDLDLFPSDRRDRKARLRRKISALRELGMVPTMDLPMAGPKAVNLERWLDEYTGQLVRFRTHLREKGDSMQLSSEQWLDRFNAWRSREETP